MSDLQCPATAVLLEAGAELPAWVERLPIAAWFEAQDPASLAALIEETADRFRGETFAVTAPGDAVARTLHARGVRQSAPAVVEIDATGWSTITP